MYTGEKVDDQLIEDLLEAANCAPHHKKTEPWRWHVFTGETLESLSRYGADWYEANITGDKYSELKHKKIKKNPLKASHVIAICMQRDPKESVPEWEEEAAVACAVQNMWLMCTAMELGCYWSSPRYALEAGEFLGLTDGQKCLGFFYIGVPQEGLPNNPSAGHYQDKVTWHR